MTYKRTLATSFITTVAAVASAAMAFTAGCTGGVFTTCEGCGGAATTSSSSGKPNCPASLPTAGAACNEEGLTCLYGDAVCDPSAICQGGSWDIIPIGECNPPPCPAEQPQSGQACAGFLAGDICYYESQYCPGETVNATCQDDGQWLVDEIFCNPPPPDYCYYFTDPNECKQQPDCDWQVPGCDVPALPFAGCHPVGYDCSLDSWLCQADQVCKQVMVDPCWDSTCGACAEPAWLCVADSDASSGG